MLRRFLQQNIVSNSQKSIEPFSAQLIDNSKTGSIPPEIAKGKKNGDLRMIKLKNRISLIEIESFPEFENKRNMLINIIIDLFHFLKNSINSEEEEVKEKMR